MKTITSPSLNAKLKAMYSQKLKYTDLEDLTKQTSISEAIILLKSKLHDLDKLSNTARRIELENSLDTIIINDMKKIIKYLNGTNKEIFEHYILKYKINAIIKIYDNLFISNIPPSPNEWVEELFNELKVLYTATTIDDFIEKIDDKNIRNIFYNNTTDFERENALNKYYFESFLKLIKGENKNIESLLKTQIDLLNILWTYRTKKYYDVLNPNILIKSFYKIDIETIKNIEEINSLSDLNHILDSTNYKGIINNNIELDIKKYLYLKYKNIFRKELLDLSLVISYFNILEIEKENIVTIIECIRYNVPKQNINNKIII